MDIIDLSALVSPVSQEAPCGKDLHANTSFNSLYSQIKEERFLARRVERERSEDSSKTHWKKVYKYGVEILSSQSKDLQVTCWLIEASIRLYGFNGLGESLKLARLLIESYWDQLYPQLDKEGLDARIAGFVGLNGDNTEGTLIFPLLDIPLTSGKSAPSFSTWQIQYINHIKGGSSLPENNTLDNLNAETLAISVTETDPNEFKLQQEIIQHSSDELDLLDQALSKKCGSQAPSFGEIKKTLLNCLSCLKSIAPFVSSADNQEYPSVPTEGSPATFKPQFGNINDRESAFKELIEISNFFQQSEPHSPLPYLLRKAVRWGNTPLVNLFEELVGDQSALARIYSLTGIEDSFKK